MKTEILSINDIVGKMPSLPSGLDEAAENCTYCEHAYARESFKEGAEWMAGQGVKIGETEIYLEYELEGSPYSQQWLSLENTEFKIHDGVFKTGDEVEVILRKKQ